MYGSQDEARLLGLDFDVSSGFVRTGSVTGMDEQGSRWKRRRGAGRSSRNDDQDDARKRAGGPRPVFKLVMNGYDRRQVDDYLAGLPEDANLPAPGFDLVMRGYDPGEVELYAEHIRARLREHPPT